MKRLCLLLLLVGCQHKHTNADPKTVVKLRDELLAEWSQVTSGNHYGWPDENDCDGALWAGEARAAGLQVDIAAALQPDGRPTRLPNADCGKDRSAATTSTDMQARHHPWPCRRS